jgi:hypothetical protein
VRGHFHKLFLEFLGALGGSRRGAETQRIGGETCYSEVGAFLGEALAENRGLGLVTIPMLRFNTSFLLKAAVVVALCCLPMALDDQSGFVFTAFLLPASLATLAATQVEEQGEFEFRFQRFPNSAVEISTVGGRTHQVLTRLRVIGAGACLSLASGFPALHQVDPEPPEMWAPIVALCAAFAIFAVGFSARRRVLVDERAFLTEYLLFGWPCWRRKRWQVRDGDYLAVIATGYPLDERNAVMHFGHTLFVCRGKRRQLVACRTSGSERLVPGLEVAAQLAAALVELPYRGYEVKRIPWAGQGSGARRKKVVTKRKSVSSASASS